MDIKRNGAQPSAKGPADWFTGSVRIDTLFQARGPRARRRRQRYLRTRARYRLAHASARPDAHRHLRLRLDAVLGRTRRGDPAR